MLHALSIWLLTLVCTPGWTVQGILGWREKTYCSLIRDCRYVSCKILIRYARWRRQ